MMVQSSRTMSPAIFLSLATADDVPWLAPVWADSMDKDRHTQMKSHADKKPYDKYAVASGILEAGIAAKSAVVIKAMVSNGGEQPVPAGWASWGWRGLTDDEGAAIKARLGREEIHSAPPVRDDQPIAADSNANNDDYDDDDDDKNDVVSRIQDHTSANMREWMDKLMPPGSRCIFFMTCCVASEFQGRGVGSAMIRWINEIADGLDVFVWVHSSQDAWKMYEKQGYDVVGVFDVDLDHWARDPPPNEGEGAKWGLYTFRYMKRLPLKHVDD